MRKKNMINLIPEKFKKELKQQAQQRLIFGVEGYFLLLLICFLVGLGLIYSFLWAELNFQKATLQGYRQGEEVVRLDAQIKELNDRALAVAKFKQGMTSQVGMLRKISDNLVSGIKISNITAKKNKDGLSYQIKITGLAKDNSSLFDFRSKLEGDKEISKLVIPDTLFLQDQDINFEISFEYKKL